MARIYCLFIKFAKMDISKPDNRSEMSALIETLAPHEGYTQTRLANVNLMRANHPIGRHPSAL